MNNRLIRLNSFAFKMMEQMYLETTSKHMKGRKVFWNSQHGFLKKKSCLIKLMKLLSQWTTVEQWIFLVFALARLMTLSPITSIKLMKYRFDQ